MIESIRNNKKQTATDRITEQVTQTIYEKHNRMFQETLNTSPFWEQPSVNRPVSDSIFDILQQRAYANTTSAQQRTPPTPADTETDKYVTSKIEFPEVYTFHFVEEFFSAIKISILEHWCKENCVGAFTVSCSNAHFADETDAVAFKIRWL